MAIRPIFRWFSFGVIITKSLRIGFTLVSAGNLRHPSVATRSRAMVSVTWIIANVHGVVQHTSLSVHPPPPIRILTLDAANAGVPRRFC